jgi:hypothetical protein
VTLLVAGAFVGARTTAAATAVPVVPMAPAQVTASHGEPSRSLLADEITRRLRRMGIIFSRTRLPHPYDPIGEVC